MGTATASGRPAEWDRMSHHARARWLRRHGLHPNGRPVRSRQATVPPPSSGGKCLTAAWDSLSPGEKARWLAVVEAEAAAVRADADRRRQERLAADLDTAEELAAVLIGVLCLHDELDSGAVPQWTRMLAEVSPQWAQVMGAVYAYNQGTASTQDMQMVRLYWRTYARIRSRVKRMSRRRPPGSGIP